MMSPTNTSIPPAAPAPMTASLLPRAPEEDEAVLALVLLVELPELGELVDVTVVPWKVAD